MLIKYRVRPLLSIPVTWVTEITDVDEPNLFVDVQKIGPYKHWHHEHRFTSIPGGTEITDFVTYALAAEPFSRFLHPILIRKRLRSIFEFRSGYLRDKFGEIRE